MRTPWSFESLWSQGCSHQCTNIAFWNNITWLRATNSLHDLHIVMFLRIEVVPVLSMSTMLDSSSCWDWALFSVRTYSNLRDSISSFTKVGFFSRQNTYTSCPAREYWNIEVRNWNILAYHSPIRKSSHWPTTSLTAASNVPDYATKLSPRKTVTLVISLPAGRCVMRTVAEAEALGMKGGQRNKLSVTPWIQAHPAPGACIWPFLNFIIETVGWHLLPKMRIT